MWPDGTSVADDGGVEMPDGKVVRVGDRLDAQGAFVTAPYPDHVPEVPEACGSETGEVVVLNPAPQDG